MNRSAAVFVLIALVSGCTDITLEVAHIPAVESIGAVDAEDHEIEISVGTALAIECTVTPAMRACSDVEAIVDDESISSSYRLHLDRFVEAYAWPNEQRAGFILVGRRQGKTTLEVITGDGDAQYQIHVVP